MDAIPAYLGVVVTDLQRSTEWYEGSLGCIVDEAGAQWASLVWPNGSVVELFEGDPARPGLAHPGYAADSRSPMIPGYAVEDPMWAAEGLPIAQRFPDWVVAVTPDGLHLVLRRYDMGTGTGLVGFRYASPAPGPQRQVLAGLGVTAAVFDGPFHAVVPIVLGGRGEVLTDPDGNTVELVGAA